MTYRVLDHDADILLEVYGTSQKELFENAARALVSFITDPEGVTSSVTAVITVAGDGEPLVNFLNEIIYLWETKGFIPADTSVVFDGRGLTAVMKGQMFDETKHIIKEELKAVTYHKFSITEKDGVFKAVLVIDV